MQGTLRGRKLNVLREARNSKFITEPVRGYRVRARRGGVMMMHVCCTKYTYPVLGHRYSERGSSASDNSIIVRRLLETGRNASAKHFLLTCIFTGIKCEIPRQLCSSAVSDTLFEWTQTRNWQARRLFDV